MIFDDKIDILNYVNIAGDYIYQEEKVIDIIQQKFTEDQIQHKSTVKKINDYGWSNIRQIYLTNNRIINTDDKCILKRNKKLVFLESLTNQVIIINKKNVENTQKYYFEFSESPSEFIHFLQIQGISKNNHLKFYVVIDSNISFNNLFFNEVSPEVMDNLILDHQIKQLNFPKQVKYLIDKQKFLIQNLTRATQLFKEDQIKFNTEDFFIVQILEKKEYVTVFLLQNKQKKTYCVLKLYKKWQLGNNCQQKNQYQDMFYNFKNTQLAIQIYSIYEDNIFLYIFCEFMPFNNLYNFMYNEFDKNTLNEQEVFIMFQKLFNLIQQSYNKEKCLFCIQAENIYFDENEDFKLSLLSKEKLQQEFSEDRDVKISIEYCPPYIFTDDIIDVQYDYWQLGILLYECLYGVTPFQQDSQQETKNQILDSKIFFPEVSSKKISEQIKSFIKFLLIKQYEQRREQINIDSIKNHEWVQQQQKQQPLLNFQKIKDRITVKINTKDKNKYFKDFITF